MVKTRHAFALSMLGRARLLQRTSTTVVASVYLSVHFTDKVRSTKQMQREMTQETASSDRCASITFLISLFKRATKSLVISLVLDN